MKILICQLKNNGDIIRIFPLIDAIKYYYPDSYIGFTCFEEMIPVVSVCKNIDIIYPQPKFNPVTDTEGGTRILDCSIFEEIVKRVKKEEFDMYIDLHGVFQSAIFGAMCNIKIRLGRSKETAKDGASIFYTDICEIKEKEINRMERHFVVTQKILNKIQPLKHENFKDNNVITIFPGSSKKGILKRWDIDKYIAVANYCSKKYIVRFVLGPEENELFEKISKSTTQRIIVSNNWEEMIKLISESFIVIGNDGAYVHMAVWKNIFSIMLCGPLSPVVNGVWKYGKGKTLYNKERCYCKYLWSGICNNNHVCLEKIEAQDVIRIIKELEENIVDK